MRREIKYLRSITDNVVKKASVGDIGVAESSSSKPNSVKRRKSSKSTIADSTPHSTVNIENIKTENTATSTSTTTTQSAVDSGPEMVRTNI